MAFGKTTLDREVAKIARGQESILGDKHVLQSAARFIRDTLRAIEDARKAAGLPKGAEFEYYIGIVGHDAKPAKDVLELERLFSLEDPRG